MNENQKYVNPSTYRGMASAEILLPGSSFMSWGWCSSKAILGLKIALLPFPQKVKQVAIELDNSELKLSQSLRFLPMKGKGREQSQCCIYLQSKQIKKGSLLLKQVMWLVAPDGRIL